MDGQKKLSRYLLYSAFLAVIFSGNAFGKNPDEGEFTAGAALGNDIAKWIRGLNPQPKSVAIFAVNPNAPLEQDHASLVETEIQKAAARQGITYLTTCKACKNPQVSVQGDHVVVTKGPLDLEAMKKIGQSQTVDNFLVVDLYRTSFSMTAQAVLYQNPTGVVVASERFSSTAMNFTTASVQFLLTFGLGKVIQGRDMTSTATFALWANMSLLEEIGFAKAGMNLGGMLAGTNGLLVYMNPTLAFRGTYGNSGLGWSFMLGAGYGFTSEAKGITFRGAYELFFGSWAAMGIEAIYLVPDSAIPTMTCVAGLHVGIALGR